MNPSLGLVAALLLSYLLGSVPTGLWLGLRLRKVDIREHGSKNIGATNTMRVLGKKLGAVALTCDILKGVVPVLVLSRLGGWEHLPLVCGLLAVLGHVTSPLVGFKGGKGVATSAGVFFALAPVATFIALVTFSIILKTTRMVSASSIAAAVALTVAIWILPGASMALQVVTSVLAALVILRHHSNIVRILKGQENRI